MPHWANDALPWPDFTGAIRSRFGGIVAPPTFPYSVFPAGIGPGLGHEHCHAAVHEKADIKITQVNYKGGADILTAMQRGDVQAYFSVLQSAITGVQSGKVRVLVATSTVRHRDFPNVPSFAEQGVNMISKSWYGLVAPDHC
jgi:tripartite-type tricarboxylate transporter receptor subunit TctC